MASGSSSHVTVHFEAAGYACRKQAPQSAVRRLDELELETDEVETRWKWAPNGS